MSQPAPQVSFPYARPCSGAFTRNARAFVCCSAERFGKTVAAVNDLVRQALRVGRDDWRAAYAAPAGAEAQSRGLGLLQALCRCSAGYAVS